MPYLCCKTVSHRARDIYSTVLIALALFAPAFGEAAQDGSEVLGKWKFTAALKGIQITSLDETEAKQLVGHVMTIRKDGTRFGDRVCGAPSFETKRVEPNLHLQREAGVNASRLGLPNPVTVVDISCTEVLLKKRNRAVIFWKGWFFAASKLSD